MSWRTRFHIFGQHHVMASDASTVRIAGNGRVSLPARQRRLVGLEHGGVVVVRVEDGEIRIRPVLAVVEEVQALARRYFDGSGDSVDAFLSDRRDAAAHEG